MVECLFSNHEALSLNPSTTKKKKKRGWVLVAHTCNPSYLED
jgi:hypothetical protein